MDTRYLRSDAIDQLHRNEKEDRMELDLLCSIFETKKNFCGFDELEVDFKTTKKVLKSWQDRMEEDGLLNIKKLLEDGIMILKRYPDSRVVECRIEVSIENNDNIIVIRCGQIEQPPNKKISGIGIKISLYPIY